MGIPYGINNTIGQVPAEECVAILNLAFESGLVTLDSAEAYGTAHQIIGSFHRRFPGRTFDVITKLSADSAGYSPENKIRQFLVELNVQCLDGLMFHSFDSYGRNIGIIDSLLDLKGEGLFNQLGVSVYTNQEVEAASLDERIDFIQLPFNLLDNTFQRASALQTAKKRGKEIHTRSVFLQGLFFMGKYSKNKIAAQLQPQLEAIRRLADDSKTSVSTLALSYALSQPLIDKVLIGVDSTHQLKMNVEAAKFNLDNNVREYIDQLTVPDKSLINPSLWN